MNKEELILEIDKQLINNENIILNKEKANQIVKLLKSIDILFKNKKSKEQMKKDIINELKHYLEITTDEKLNHLILADDSKFHHSRFIASKEKCDLLEELINFVYNYN